MAKSRQKSRFLRSYLFIALVLALAAFGYGYYRSLLQPSNIFVIDEAAVQYGDTVLSGTLRKDTAMGQTGNYILVLSDGRPVLLDSQGLDGLVGSQVIVTGTLSPAASNLSPMTMVVNSITVANSL